MPELLPELKALEKAYERPSVVRALEEIEGELILSCEVLKEQVAGTEGASLLSWVHTLRYYVSRCQSDLKDVRLWAETAANYDLARSSMNREVDRLRYGWPMLASQAAPLLRRLEALLTGAWSPGKGRKAKAIRDKLGECFQRLRRSGGEAEALRAETVALVGNAPPAEGSRAARSAQEFDEMKALSPRIEHLHREIAGQFRLARLEFDVRAMSERQREASKFFAAADVHDWADAIKRGYEAVAAVHPLAQDVMCVAPAAALLMLKLRDDETRQELAARRESLARAALSSNLARVAETDDALDALTWFTKRLQPDVGSRHFCTRYGDAILPGDSSVQCPECRSFCHPECLREGRCPVDGHQIIAP